MNFIKRMCGTTTLCNLALIKIKNLGFADLNLFFFQRVRMLQQM